MTGTGIQKIAFVVLILVMFGVCIGVLGGP